MIIQSSKSKHKVSSKPNKSHIILPKPKSIQVVSSIESFKGKSRDYVEQMFSDRSSSSLPWEAFPDDYDPLDQIAADGDFDLSSLMDKAVDEITGLPRDIRLPEGDFPEAKNYYDYCENFLGPDTKKPFARQMWAAIHLLAEFCPRCSHPKWTDIWNVRVDVDSKNIPNNVQLLHYGVCPRCKATKSEFFAAKEMNLYVEGAWLWGQRSGKSTLTASLTNYLIHKYLKYPKMSSICEGIQSSTPLTATFVGVRFADAVATLWEPITKGIHDSPWFCLAEGTPIRMADGSSKPIEDVTAGNLVMSLEGPNEVLNHFDNGVQDCTLIELASGTSLVGTNQHQVRCLGQDGLSIVWKSIGDITEKDFVLTV